MIAAGLGLLPVWRSEITAKGPLSSQIADKIGRPTKLPCS